MAPMETPAALAWLFECLEPEWKGLIGWSGSGGGRRPGKGKKRKRGGGARTRAKATTHVGALLPAMWGPT